MPGIRLAFASVLFLLPLIPTAQAEPLKVVASFTILGDLTQQVGGDLVQVTSLVGPDGDAHVYEPKPGDGRTLSEAKLLVVNGLGMEGWMDRLAKAADYHGLTVVASQGVKASRMEEDGKTITDPHAWQDVANGKLYVANIAMGLAQADPDHAAQFKANAARLEAELGMLDGWVRSQLSAIPLDKRKAITSHDALGYFGRAYGVTFLAPQGINTEAEPTAKGLASLIRQIKTSHIKAIFLENMSDPRLVEQLTQEAGAVVGGTLYVDALSKADGPAANYQAMFRHNVPLLAEAMARN